jgi:hypothetical protein
VTMPHMYSALMSVRCMRAVLEGPDSFSRPSCTPLLAAVVDVN